MTGNPVIFAGALVGGIFFDLLDQRHVLGSCRYAPAGAIPHPGFAN